MSTIAIAAALLVGAAFAQAPTPERLEALRKDLPNWAQQKKKAETLWGKMLIHYREKKLMPDAEFDVHRGLLASRWDVLEQIEGEFMRRRARAREAIEARRAAGKLKPERADKMLAEIDESVFLTIYYAYGNRWREVLWQQFENQAATSVEVLGDDAYETISSGEQAALRDKAPFDWTAYADELGLPDIAGGFKPQRRAVPTAPAAPASAATPAAQ